MLEHGGNLPSRRFGAEIGVVRVPRRRENQQPSHEAVGRNNVLQVKMSRNFQP